MRVVWYLVMPKIPRSKGIQCCAITCFLCLLFCKVKWQKTEEIGEMFPCHGARARKPHIVKTSPRLARFLVSRRKLLKGAKKLNPGRKPCASPNLYRNLRNCILWSSAEFQMKLSIPNTSLKCRPHFCNFILIPQVTNKNTFFTKIFSQINLKSISLFSY